MSIRFTMLASRLELRQWNSHSREVPIDAFELLVRVEPLGLQGLPLVVEFLKPFCTLLGGPQSGFSVACGVQGLDQFGPALVGALEVKRNDHAKLINAFTLEESR